MSKPSLLLVLGTHNRKKGAEMQSLLSPHGLDLRTLSDFPTSIDVVEDGESFAANAILKATQQAKHLHRWVLAEDSGLEVDALRGAPGIYSARFAGQQATDEENNIRLLEKLGETPLEQRTARYICHMAVSDPAGVVRCQCEAYCRGRIRFVSAGSGGFGYDPLFEIPEYHRTFGEMSGALKSIISHRGRAARLLIPQLVMLARKGTWTSGEPI